MYWQEITTTHLQKLIDRPRFGLITDMDGTISPIVEVPDEAQVTPRNRELLGALTARLPLVAVVSGRAAADIHQRLGLPDVVYIGNHGFERWRDGQVEPMPAAAAYRPNLEAARQAIADRQADGMWVEDKGVTLSVHYRQTANPTAIAAEYQPVVQEVAAKHDLRFFQGRMVFELRPPLEADKGSALADLVREYRLDAALYLGDDTTDVDAFHQARKLREQQRCYALAAGVESEDMPATVRTNADFLVSGVSGVELLLDWLLRAVKASVS